MKTNPRTSAVAVTTTAACLFTVASAQIASAQRKGGKEQTERRAAAIPLPSGERGGTIDSLQLERTSSRRAPTSPTTSPPAGGESAFEFPLAVRRIDGYGNNE
ncbi:MAG: hypothetical protein ACR2RV_28210, partial [Verrucomicrobiales bacterium]